MANQYETPKLIGTETVFAPGDGAFEDVSETRFIKAMRKIGVDETAISDTGEVLKTVIIAFYNGTGFQFEITDVTRHGVSMKRLADNFEEIYHIRNGCWENWQPGLISITDKNKGTE